MISPFVFSGSIGSGNSFTSGTQYICTACNDNLHARLAGSGIMVVSSEALRPQNWAVVFSKTGILNEKIRELI